LAEKFELSNLQLPQELPLSLPSQPVGQRPDVRQAEENLHAASAQIGIAIANRLPSIALTADGGSSPTAFSTPWEAVGGTAPTSPRVDLQPKLLLVIPDQQRAARSRAARPQGIASPLMARLHRPPAATIRIDLPLAPG